MTFTITTATLPLRITVGERTSRGVWHPITYRRTVMRDVDADRECQRCHVRVIDTHVYRDSLNWRIWHTTCFERELTARRVAGSWRIQLLEWSE